VKGRIGAAALLFLGDELGRGVHLAAGDAELVEEFQLAPDIGAGDLAAAELFVARD